MQYSGLVLLWMAFMRDPQSDDRSPIAKAYHWSSLVVTVCLEMIVPGLVGLWVDRQLGTWVVFGVLGFAIGMTVGIWHLLRLTGSSGER